VEKCNLWFVVQGKGEQMSLRKITQNAAQSIFGKITFFRGKKFDPKIGILL
jgi:hypothetical protein